MSTTQQQIKDRIAAIDAVLASGVTSSSTDGESASLDHDSLRRERTRLEIQLGRKKRRARVFSFNLNGR